MQQSIINHVVLVVDRSSSMYKHQNTVVEVVDSTVKFLAERSQANEQETRITVYTFSSGFDAVKCLFYDMDVLRMPSMRGLYQTNGMTALRDATLKSIEDLEKTATLYGDHAFLVYVVTDGLENSSRATTAQLNRKLSEVQTRGNWSLAAFAPDRAGVEAAILYGFPRENVTLWETGTTAGVEAVGNAIRTTTSTWMDNRSKGIRSSSNLFKLNTLTVHDIKSLVPMIPSSYLLPYFTADTRADDAYVYNMGKPWIIGNVYYQLTKKETIQPQKNIAILYDGRIYTGPQARQLLGLPDTSVDVTPGDSKYKEYKIFVQSTAPNRKILKGTYALLIR